MRIFVFGLTGVFLLSLAASGRADVFNLGGTINDGTWTGTASLSFVPVGNPGNAPDTWKVGKTNYSYGSVPYSYNIGTYDVTLGQYAAFLNAVATTADPNVPASTPDPYGLYNSDLATDSKYNTGSGQAQGIVQSTNPDGSYSYSVIGSNPQAANTPAFAISWGDAARFTNWLNNGQPTSGVENSTTTENGAYNLNGATSDVDLLNVASPSHSGPGAPQYFLPTVNEWFKAAYYNPTTGKYYQYPTSSNTAPGNNLPDTGNNANYSDANWNSADNTNGLTPVGAFKLSASPYGTYDQGGNVWQWNQDLLTNSFTGNTRALRGGYWGTGNGVSYLEYNELYASNQPSFASPEDGFRVAESVQSVPEPGSLALAVAAAVAGLWLRRRWR